ncbi:24-hydroxycholesterol 7-alpha-hydroxylase [Patella vulgata]|uniref:24-hydroxycholesterol 7-alpha-hydroxylase n=2 Tax=Patella vulgata TaxID=6465 RepID=UPI0024A9112F|nr:24-hydroxycholesterol 7-alpha-hydroxylase [Patella vulgata]
MALETILSGNWIDIGLIGSLTLIVIVYFREKWDNLFAEKPKTPPTHKGWIPWLGLALEFGKGPLHFIDRKRKELGSVFSIKVAGEYMTFLTDPKDFQHFFLSPCLDFQKAVQGPVQNVASITKESFFKYHSSIHDLVKGKLAPSNLSPLMSHKLYKEFEEQLGKLPSHGKMDLNRLIRTIMYKSVLNIVFGKNILPTDNDEQYQILEEHFTKFDRQIEYGSKLPAFVLGAWSKSRKYLITMFQNIVDPEKQKSQELCPDDKTLLHNLLECVDIENAPNYSVLLLWATLANSIPMVFWTIAFIVTQESVYKKVCEEIERELPSTFETISDADLRKLPYLKSCILETVRLRSPGIIPRYVTKPFEVKGYTVPAGNLVFASPFWAHRNPEYYPDPETHKPERWNMKDVERNIFPEYFFAFGGGRFQCPGRWFGLMEIQIFAIMFLKQFKCEAFDPVPPPSPLHAVGTQQPEGPCMIEFTRLPGKC